MYRKTCQNKELPEIGLYFVRRLNPENHRVKMTDLVPWEEWRILLKTDCPRWSCLILSREKNGVKSKLQKTA